MPLWMPDKRATVFPLDLFIGFHELSKQVLVHCLVFTLIVTVRNDNKF